MSDAERAARLKVIKARIQAALDDPRPSLSMEEVSARLDEMIAEAIEQEESAAA